MKKDQEILAELINKGMIYKKQKIYYSSVQRENAGDDKSKEPTFLEMYTPYRNLMTETEFVRILKIAASTLSMAKKATCSERMTVNVFNEEKMTEEEKAECISFLIDKYSLGASHSQRGSGIYYSQRQMDNAGDAEYEGPFFLVMYQELPLEFKTKCSEKEFADLLGMRNFAEFKGPNYKYKATLNFSITQLNEEERKKILDYLIRKYSLQKGQKVYYSRKYAKEKDYQGPCIDDMFQKLPDEVRKRLTIEDIINLLGIKSFNQTRAMAILGNNKLEAEEAEAYFNYLINTYELTSEYSKKGIFFSQKQKSNSVDVNYNGPYLLDMYRQSPIEFRAKCTIYEMIQLLQTTKSFRASTQDHSKDKIVILINQELTEEENDEINGLIGRLEGKKIQYYSGENCFRQMYQKYRLKLTEREFAQRLGITAYSLEMMKMKPEYIVTVVDVDKVNKTRTVLTQVTESRFYSLEELEQLCSENGISVRDFIVYMYAYGRNSGERNYDLLRRKGKIYIQEREFSRGKFVLKTNFPMTEKMYESIYDVLYEKLTKSANLVYSRYKKSEVEDLVQVGLENVFSRGGELEINFHENGRFDTEEDEEFFWECAIGRAKRYMKYYIWKIKDPLTISLQIEDRQLTDFYRSKQGLKVSNHDEYFDEDLIDETVFFDDEELINWEKDDDESKAVKLKNIIEKYIACGEYNASEIIKIVQSRFGISERDMNNLLSVLQQSMVKHGFAKKASFGKVNLGDGNR